MDRTDSANHVFRFLDSSGIAPEPLKIIVECKFSVNLSFFCNTEKSVLQYIYIYIISYYIYIDVILYYSTS